jgi:hypothetical protein
MFCFPIWSHEACTRAFVAHLLGNLSRNVCVARAMEMFRHDVFDPGCFSRLEFGAPMNRPGKNPITVALHSCPFTRIMCLNSGVPFF